MAEIVLHFYTIGSVGEFGYFGMVNCTNICTYILTNINTSYSNGEIFKKLTFIAISIDNTYAILKTDFL